MRSKANKKELQSPTAIVDVGEKQDLKVDLALAASTPEPPDAGLSPAVARKFEAMEARIEQLEAELKARSAPEQAATPALRGDLVATATKDPSQIPIVPATLTKPDLSKAVASATGPTAPSGQ